MIVDGYVRVSKVGGRSGERFIAPSEQRAQIERWAALQGALVGRMFEELDESGGRKDRPLLESAIARVEHSESDGLVVAYMSRFGRSMLDGLLAIKRITDAGGTFVSVQEGLDFSTDVGRHTLRTMLSWAEWELDRTRSNWNRARERAVARGVWMAGRPFGYRRSANGRLAPEPGEAPVMVELFRLRGDGVPILTCAGFLMERGVRTARGGLDWDHKALRRMLASRTYRGEVHHGAFSNREAHEPVVDEATWQRAQRPYERVPWTRGHHDAPLLHGLLRCAGCQRIMASGTMRTASGYLGRHYKCKRRATASLCPAPTQVMDAVVEPHIEAILWQELARARRSSAPTRTERSQHELERREQELAAYRDNPRLPVTLGAARFAAGLGVRARRVDEARLELSRARFEAEAQPLPPTAELRREWPSLSLDARRDVIARVIDCAFLRAGDEPIEERLHVCLRGKAPSGLPPANLRRPVETRPFDPSMCPAPVRLRTTVEPWSEERMRGMLAPLLGRERRWPGFMEFQAAGLALLHAEIRRQGGTRRWAALMRVPYRPPRYGGRLGAWSERRVRAELRDYLRDKDAWPSAVQFAADGRQALRRAVTWLRGPEYWAAEMGFDLNRSQRTRRCWNYALIKQELADFVGDRPDWPPRRDFQAAGLECLYTAIRARKTRPRLAGELGLHLPPGPVHSPRRWTDANIAAALDELLAGRDQWPSYREFERAGLAGLWNRLRRTGSRDEWVQRYGVPVHPY
jgi:site-specific DNA recombinase